MMKKKIKIHYISLLILTSLCQSYCTNQPVDLTIVGYINFADGIGRQTIGLIEELKNDLSINVIPTHKNNFTDVAPDIIHIASDSFYTPGNVAILEDLLTMGKHKYYHKVPKECEIKISYTMFESSEILPEWVEILNSCFDAAVVPDEFLVDVYKNSGVTIPIFVIPLGLFLEEFLTMPEKPMINEPFIFGCATDFLPRKNHILLLESFMEEFGNDPNVLLKINGRRNGGSYKEIKEKLEHTNPSNVIFSLQSLPWQEYKDFLYSLDCYVSLAKGEGFSIIPRECLALGIPCILSNNTGQKTICSSPGVLSVTSTIEEPALFPHLSTDPIGFNYNCEKNEVKKALREMYNNHKTFIQAAKTAGKAWVKQYLHSAIKEKYLTLIKPQKIILGTVNNIDGTTLTTNNKTLFNKYLNIQTK